MSTHLPTETEAFYQFLGLHIGQGACETSPEQLLLDWRKRRELVDIEADVSQAVEELNSGQFRPIEEFDSEFRKQQGLQDRASE